MLEGELRGIEEPPSSGFVRCAMGLPEGEDEIGGSGCSIPMEKGAWGIL